MNKLKLQTGGVLLLLLLQASAAVAQSTFQNLDFESAQIPGDRSGQASVVDALPGWSVFYGTAQQSQILYNAPSLGTTEVSLCIAGAGSYCLPLDGSYSVLLQGGVFGPGYTPTPASISQTGLIPVGTQSLVFEALSNGGTLDVYIGDQLIPVTGVDTGLYGVDISEWAGQTEQITFSTAYYWELDDISFSTVPVPEPSVFSLSAVGALLFSWPVIRRRL